jgi:type IV pilus assembly protein PilW
MRSRTLRERLSGMSVVELMVAMAIGLAGVIVIFQVYAVNEGIRRSTTAGSDEQTSGILGLTLIERELRHAGFGINDFDLIGCTMQMYDSQQTPSDVPAFPLTAVAITSNAGSTPDVITVTYGQPTQTTAPVLLSKDMDDPTARLDLIYRFGFSVNDVLLVAQPNAPCTLRQVTSLPPTNAGAFLNHAGGVRFNKGSGTPMAYQALAQARVINLGASPVRNQITVRTGAADPSSNNQLIVTNRWGDNTATAVAEQIVQLKAEYGMDDGINNGTVTRATYLADDNMVDRYTTAAPATPQAWGRVRSVRIAIVSRSNAPEKPNSGTTCDATPAFDPTLNPPATGGYPVRWAYGPDAPKGRPIDVSSDPNWRCYKYKVYETVVPLRNMLWRQA